MYCLQRVEADDLRARVDELLVVADVIRMMVRVDHVLHRQLRDRADLLHQPLVVLVARELRIDDDQALGRHANERVRAGAGDQVEIGLELSDLLDDLTRGSTAAARSATLRRLCERRRTKSRDKTENDYREPHVTSVATRIP